MTSCAKPNRRAIIVAAFVIAFIATPALFLYSVAYGIPFIEGDRIVRSGSAYCFEIGCSREDAFQVVKQSYNEPGIDLFVAWERDSALNAQLTQYETPDSKQYRAGPSAYWRQPVSHVNELSPPLLLADQWHLKMPGRWVNAIYLTFSNDRLTEVQRSRWVFDRP